MTPPTAESTRRAAYRWLAQLQFAEVWRVRALFTNHRAYSDLTPGQYAQGLAWLMDAGLVSADGRPAVRIRPDSLSDAEAAVARVICARDLEARKITGEAGELALLDLLRTSGAQNVRHVAAVSDAYGYDIEATLPDLTPVHIEAKATTNASRLVVHLSRHEFETMRTDVCWMLVAVLIGAGGRAQRVVTVSRSWLDAVAPVDVTGDGQWESARLTVPPEAMSPGIVARSGSGQICIGMNRKIRDSWSPSPHVALAC
ncbi:DUF3883 domain-containing protein [Streptomyces sp. NPDC005373]|uniref:protein NO VEIN domain-containing protein n=1 Tax=unclassified Streptomyces TaxID=2593676 RepID=UPI0033B7D2FD